MINIIKTNKYEDNNYVLTITEQTQIIGWEDENHDPITSDPSIAETGTEITNPSWNITEAFANILINSCLGVNSMPT